MVNYIELIVFSALYAYNRGGVWMKILISSLTFPAVKKKKKKKREELIDTRKSCFNESYKFADLGR